MAGGPPSNFFPRVASTQANPHALSWMLFVDGENFTIRAQALGNGMGLSIPENERYKQGSYLWTPQLSPLHWPAKIFRGLVPRGRRAHYYTSVRGDDEAIKRARQVLHSLAFKPTVLKRTTAGKMKGVDLSLATDVLGNAYRGNFEAAIIATGDGDFVPVVEELQRLGKIVYVIFIDRESANDELLLASDGYLEVGKLFVGNCCSGS